MENINTIPQEMWPSEINSPKTKSEKLKALQLYFEEELGRIRKKIIELDREKSFMAAHFFLGQEITTENFIKILTILNES